MMLFMKPREEKLLNMRKINKYEKAQNLLYSDIKIDFISSTLRFTENEANGEPVTSSKTLTPSFPMKHNIFT